MPEKRTFFISRAGADKRWAELIASVVRDAGHVAIYEDQDFQVGQSIADSMMRASEADCTIAVLSRAYLDSEYCLSELNAALFEDPLGRRGRVIPVRVEAVELPSLVAHLAYLDLVGVRDDAARQRLMTTLLRHGQVGASKLALVGRTRRAVEQASRNRCAMIEKVRTIWITGFLKQSLPHEVRILLGLSERADAVARPFDLLVKPPDRGERPLPTRTEVVDVFDTMDRSLLILGAPGSGKTTLLLELARDLLDRATNDSAHPIPVVFPLSTWAETRKPLLEWLQDELNLRYDVPRAIAQEWVLTDQVLPMLDGLDEVNAVHRATCVEAINVFRQCHGFLPLVITSRTADYEALAEQLRVHGAILVLPLTREQVDAYLADLGSAGEPVRAAIRDDASLWELLDSPLLLNIITVSYAGQTAAPVPTRGTVVARRDQLFGSYVNQVLRRRAAECGYASAETIHWLSWLASQMAKHGQTVFYLERLQPDWLPATLRWAVGACNDLVFGFVFGLIFGLGPFVLSGRGEWIIPGSVFGLAIGLIMGLLSLLPSRRARVISSVEKVRWSWNGFRWNLIRNGLIVGVVIGVVVGTCCAVVAGLQKGVLAGLLGGLLAGPILALVVGVSVLLGGLLGELFNSLTRGLTIGELETRTVPNEGILSSGRNSFLGALVGVLLGGSGGGLILGLRVWTLGGHARFEVWFGALIGALYLGAFLGMRAGGEACVKHYVLRLLLIVAGSTPWNYVRFLDQTAERILLRKVGGGYAFLHRMLLEHFAARYVEPSVEGTPPPKPSPIGDELEAA